MATATVQDAPAQEIRLAELLSALSHALDMTEGQPAGHCVRCCWIGIHIGREIGLGEAEVWELYYTLLLKDLGCSSNAARICQLYLTDDLQFKRDYKNIDGNSVPQALRFVLAHTGLKASLDQRFRALISAFKNGGKTGVELIETRCQRGADIARKMRFSEAVAQGIQSLDEHWDGRGLPAHRRRGHPDPFAHCVAGAGGRRFPDHQRHRRRAAGGATPVRDLVRSALGRSVRANLRKSAVLGLAALKEPAAEHLRAGASAVGADRRRGLPRRYRGGIRAGGRLQEPVYQRAQRARHAVHRYDRQENGDLSRAAALAQARGTVA